ncbi:hypothetical protein AAMO2058_000763700 [Amorphochlora amoebiformis]
MSASNSRQNPTIELQKFLFHTIQALQNMSHRGEALIHLLRDMWLILNQGYFRKRKRSVLPPDPRDYVSKSEVRYVDELVGQLVLALAALLSAEEKAKSWSPGDPKGKRSGTVDPPASSPPATENPPLTSDFRRVVYLSQMLLIRLIYKPKAIKTLILSLTPPPLDTSFSSPRVHGKEELVMERAGVALGRRLRLDLAFSRGSQQDLQTFFGRVMAIANSRGSGVAPKKGASGSREFTFLPEKFGFDRKSLAHTLYTLRLVGRWAAAGGRAGGDALSPWLEAVVTRSLQQTFGETVLVREHRKPWSMMTMLSFNRTKNEDEKTLRFAFTEAQEGKEKVDTVLTNAEAVRSSLKTRLKTLSHFEANLKVLKLLYVVLEIWLRQALTTRKSRTPPLPEKENKSSNEDEKKVGSGTRIPKEAKTPHILPKGESKNSSLTRNQQMVFRKLSQHLGSKMESWQSSNINPCYGERLAAALTISSIRVVSQAESAIKADMKQNQSEAMWNALTPFWRPEEDASRGYQAAATITAVQLLSLNCALAGAQALPLRVALHMESLAQTLTEAVSPEEKRKNAVRGGGPRWHLSEVRDNGCTMLSVIDFFLKHPSPTYNVNPLISVFFSRCLSFGYADPLLAYSTIEFCVRNCGDVLRPHLVAYFPLLFKVLASFPTTFVAEFKELVRFLASQDSVKCELLHAILDLPLLTILIQIQKYFPEGERDRLFSSISKLEFKKLFGYMVRDRSCGRSSSRPPHPLISACPFWKYANERTTLAGGVTRVLWEIYFDIALQTISPVEAHEIVAALIERYDPDDEVHMCDRLLGVFEKYPQLIIQTRKILLKTIANEGRATSPLKVHIIWAVGEYLHVESTPADFSVVKEYQRALEKVVRLQISTYRAQSQHPKITQISPPMVVLGLMEQMEEEEKEVKGHTVATGTEIACRVILVSLIALCKLAARCVEIVPAVRGVLIRVLESRDFLPNTVCLRANQCARLLLQPSIAYALFKQPFFCSVHLNENTSLGLITNTPSESHFQHDANSNAD